MVSKERLRVVVGILILLIFYEIVERVEKGLLVCYSDEGVRGIDRVFYFELIFVVCGILGKGVFVIFSKFMFIRISGN